MNSLLKKSVLALLTSMLITTTVYAEPTENTTNTERSTIENLEINIEKLDNQIESVMKQIDNNNKQITETEASIKSTEKQLQETEVTFNDQKNLFNKRLKAMYVNGYDGYLNLLLKSKDMNDLFIRTELIIKLVDLNQETIDKYKHTKDLMINQKNSLETKNKTLCSLKTDNEKKLTQLNTDKESQKQLLLQAEAAENMFSGDVDAALAEAFKYIESIKGKDFSNVKDASNMDAVIAYAASFLKTPYVWGGTSPKPGFDCSGFTQYVYSHFGVSIGRTTYDQIKDGVEVKKSDLKPGDLIFFGTSSDPHHVGMYIGFGSYIHAPHTGDVIKISPLNRSDYLTARRVVSK